MVSGTRGKHVNVLQHLMGYLKNDLSGEDKEELLGLIEDYREGLVSLIAALTLLKHHLMPCPSGTLALSPSETSHMADRKFPNWGMTDHSESGYTYRMGGDGPERGVAGTDRL
jgi:hypothetical protein